MNHVFHKGTNHKTIILLHGTGGNEHDLINLGRYIDPHANLLGIRGNVLENGMPRFFKRISLGVFDEINLREETKNLRDFIEKAIIKYDLDPNHIHALGYSNGANILVSLLFLYPDIISKAMCLHAMIPLRDVILNKNLKTKVLLTSGREDHMVSSYEVKELKEMLVNAKYEVDLYETEYGHQLTEMELDFVKKWYDKTK